MSLARVIDSSGRKSRRQRRLGARDALIFGVFLRERDGIPVVGGTVKVS